jgi:cytoskeletal protein RodZ
MSEITTIAEDLTPGIGWVKLTAYIVAGLAAAGLIGFVIWKLFFAQHAADQKHDIVQAKGDAAVAAAGTQSGKEAVTTITNNYITQTKTDKQTEANKNAILQAPGANQQVDPALDALVRRDICMRPSAASLAECQRLLQPSP